MAPLADVAPLQLHCVDQVQWRYELIRPIVLFDDRTAVQRAVETHTHPETVRKLTRRFRQQGPLGLFPEHTEIVSPSRGQQGPDEVVEELARLKARYEGFQLRELARIIQDKGNSSMDDKTVTKLWQQSPGPVQGEWPFGTYHSHPQRYDARLQVIKLYYQGWNKRSISRFLQVSRPTVDLWMRRFEAEHCAGLADKGRTPHAPPRNVWFPLMVEV
jgi:proteasome lid subunit RPN8/RPN11